jgi:hypothetical protein
MVLHWTAQWLLAGGLFMGVFCAIASIALSVLGLNGHPEICILPLAIVILGTILSALDDAPSDV